MKKRTFPVGIIIPIALILLTVVALILMNQTQGSGDQLIGF